MKRKGIGTFMSAWVGVTVLFLASLVLSVPIEQLSPAYFSGTIVFSMLLFEVFITARFTVTGKRIDLIDVYKCHGIMGVISLVLCIAHAAIGLNSVGSKGMPSLTGFFGMIAIGMLVVLIATGIFSLSGMIIKKQARPGRSRAHTVHRICMLAVVLAYAHMVSLEALRGNLLFLCVTGAALCLTIFFFIREKRAVAALPALNVLSTKMVSDSICELVLTKNNKVPAHRPGQYFFLRLVNSALPREAHPFSYANWQGDTIKAYIKGLGDYTKEFHRVKPGDTATVEGPFGNLLPESSIHDDAPLVMLAGGVGITPFLSILDWLKSEFPNRRAYLFWSVSYAKEAFCCDALADYGDALPNFTSVVCVTKEDAEGLVRGRITSDLLVKYLSPDVIASGSFLLCGPPDMMESTAEILRQLKIDENRIRFERFAY